MADSLSRRTRVRPPCPGVAGAGTMDDRRQPGGATIVATAGGGARPLIEWTHFLPLSIIRYVCSPCSATKFDGHTTIRSMRPDPWGASCMQSVKFKSVISPLLFHARARGRRVGQLEAPAEKFARSSQARFGGLTLVSRAPWLLVTGAPGLFSWPNTLWTTAVACRMSPTSRTGQAAASRRHRHRNRRGAAGARPWATHAGMDAT